MAEIKAGWLVDFEDNVFAPQTLFSQVRKDDTGDTLTAYLNAQISAINSSISAVSAQVGAEATARDNADKAIKELTLLADLNSDTAGKLNSGAIGVKNTLPVKHGGTGATTLTANRLIIGNGTSAVTSVATGTTTQLLGSNGTKPVYYSVSLTSGQNTPETTGPYVKFKINNVEAATVNIPIATAGAAGVVITGAQTFAGDKTFNGALYTKSKLTVDGALTVVGAATFNSGINMNDSAITNASGYSSNISKWYFIDNNNETIAYIDENGITAHDVIVNATKLSDFMSNTNTSLTTLDSSKAPKNHASASTIYGLGSNTSYGHLKLSSEINSSSGTAGGTAATPAAVKTAYDLASGKAPKNHASTANTYGLGSNTLYGHLKLSDAINSTSDVSDGIAATPKAVKAAYDAAIAAGDNNTTINDKNLQVDLSSTSSVKLSAVNNNIGIKNTLSIANGGTGATTAAQALTNLGLTATATELNYVSGVTSSIQTQLNGKQATVTGGATTIVSDNLTANRVLESNTSGKVIVSAVTSTELGYLSGVTSNLQTQLNGKQTTISGAATTIVSNNLTASRALISDASGKVAVSAVTSTELGYLDGVTSAIQTQLNGKQATITGAATSIVSDNFSNKNCIIRSDNNGKAQSTTNYISNSKLAINSSAEPSANFYVNGTGHFKGALTAVGGLTIDTQLVLNSAIYGSLDDMNAITNPVEGQVFFVLN